MAWRTARRVVQLLFLGLFVYLFAAAKFPLAFPGSKVLPVDLLVRLSPLTALAGGLAGRAVPLILFPALIILLLTLVLGRVFCGWVCPMGTVVDVSDLLFLRSRRRFRTKRAAHHRVKYYALVGILAAALLSINVAYYLDPLALLTRTTVGAVFPTARSISNRAAGFTQQHEFFLKRGWILEGDEPFVLRSGALMGVIFMGILAMGAYHRRYWCNSLCPLGALLGAASGAGLLQRRVTDACNHCGICVRECKMASLPTDVLNKTSECIWCFDCQVDCPETAITFGFNWRPRKVQQSWGVEMPRRRALQSLGVGALYAAWASSEIGGAYTLDNLGRRYIRPERVRPPAAMTEPDFVALCIRCGECMKVCPTNALHPAIAEAGLIGLWTPVMVARVGACMRNCTQCGDVCPTGAIKKFSVEDKVSVYKQGLAWIDADRCIAWYADTECLVCDEQCSYDAIFWTEVNGRMRPFVDEEKCNGCGLCEYHCPVRPDAAIPITCRGERRPSELAPVRPFPGFTPGQFAART